jgi:adenosine kinase
MQTNSINDQAFALNLSAAFICQFFKDQLDSVLSYCDILFGNETEAEEYAKSHGWDNVRRHTTNH